eukprot:3931921-Pleurochrysis_carterae.AAC.1
MVMPERRSIARQRARAMVAAPSSPEVGSSKKSTEGIVTCRARDTHTHTITQRAALAIRSCRAKVDALDK